MHKITSQIFYQMGVSRHYRSRQPMLTQCGGKWIEIFVALQLIGERAAKVEHFGLYLSDVIRTARDRTLQQLATQIIGHLVRSYGQLTANLVDQEVHHPSHVLLD